MSYAARREILFEDLIFFRQLMGFMMGILKIDGVIDGQIGQFMGILGTVER